jgi:hypothetical protein
MCIDLAFSDDSRRIAGHSTRAAIWAWQDHGVEDSFAAASLFMLVTLSLIALTPVALISQEKPTVHRVSQSVLQYDVAGTKLEGTVTARKVFGPPGYGETPARDTHEIILVLKLTQSISVQPATNAETSGSANLDPAENVREIQLFPDRSQKRNIQRLIGQKVVVTGTLNESITASQYTKVWLAVDTFRVK